MNPNSPTSPKTPARQNVQPSDSPSPAVPPKRADMCILCSLKAKLESCFMCIECKRLMHISCIRIKDNIPSSITGQLENSRNHLCYACKDWLPYKVYDTPLYSEDQARGSLSLPSADLEAANQRVAGLTDQLNVISRQNADLKNEVLSYRESKRKY